MKREFKKIMSTISSNAVKTITEISNDENGEIVSNMSKLNISNKSENLKFSHDIKIVVTPINQNKNSNSNIDFKEQLKRIQDGKEMMWDDTRLNKQQEGGLFVFQKNKSTKQEGCVYIYLVKKVSNPENRLKSWSKNVGQQNRNVLTLSNNFIILDWNKWMKLEGPKKVLGTQHIEKNKNKIIDYINNLEFF